MSKCLGKRVKGRGTRIVQSVAALIYHQGKVVNNTCLTVVRRTRSIARPLRRPNGVIYSDKSLTRLETALIM